MRILYFTLLISLLFTAAARSSLAAIESSPHDMIAQDFFKEDETIEKSKCSYCHLIFREPGHKIWKRRPKSLKGYGNIGPFCYSCHDGVTIVDFNVDASRTAFSPKSHGLFLDNLPNIDSLENVNLKYVKDGKIECTTCHNPHNSDNRPFLAVPIEELCAICHQQWRNSGFGLQNAESNHPVGLSSSDDTEGPSPIDITEIFKTPFPEPYPKKGGKFAKDGHWDLGGHLSVGRLGNVECYTCHAVHGNEITGPNDKLMTVDPVRKVNDNFCEGCHKGQRGDGVESNSVFPNPGGTTGPRTYHPADDDIANGAGRIVEITEPEGWPFGNTIEKNVLCSTCHDVHYGLPNSPILRTPKGNTFCEECHDKEIEGHHSSGSTSNPRNVIFASTGFTWIYASETLWKNGNPVIEFEKNSAFNGYGKTYGKVVGNKIFCSSCHRAHNAGNGIEKKASPSLIVSHTATQLCFMCHPENNIAFSINPTRTASHFLGDSTNKETYEQKVEKLPIYVDEWPETELESKFGGDNEYEIICESCHSFNEKNLDNADYSYSINKTDTMLIARADEKLEWVVESEKHEIETPDSKDAVPKMYYLCVGCHGENPGGNNSHPMMNIDGLMIGWNKIDRTANQPPSTYTPSLFINCQSCHRVHTGKNLGGVYMLKEVGGENLDPTAIHPTIDFTPQCDLCHDK